MIEADLTGHVGRIVDVWIIIAISDEKRILVQIVVVLDNNEGVIAFTHAIYLDVFDGHMITEQLFQVVFLGYNAFVSHRVNRLCINAELFIIV